MKNKPSGAFFCSGIWYLALGLLFLLNAVLFICGFTNWDISRFLTRSSVTGIQIALIAAGICIGFAFFYLLIRQMEKLSERTLRTASYVLLAVIFLLQLAFIFIMHISLRYDAMWVFEEAVSMLKSGAISQDFVDGYFTTVPNNYGITIFTYWFLRLVSFFGVPASLYMKSAQILNAVCMLFTIWCTYEMIRKIKSRKSAFLFLCICALSIFPYVWAPYYYTATLSMTFMIAGLYVFVCIYYAKSRKQQVLLSLLLGFLCITGFQIRATALIAFLAIFVFCICNYKKGACKKYLPCLTAFLLTALLTFLGWKAAISAYVPFDYTDTAFPITHFMLMGAEDDGSFDLRDVEFTKSLPTKEAKLKGTTEEIFNRLEEAGPSGILTLLYKKLLNTWVDGTDGFTYEQSLCTDFTALHPYLVEESRIGYVLTYAQIFRVLQVFLVALSICFCLLKKRHTKSSPFFLLQLNLLGGILFHLLWETNPMYSIPFTTLSFALMGDGLEALQPGALSEKAAGICRKAVAFTGSAVVFTSIALLFILKTDFTSEIRHDKNHVVSQYVDLQDTPVTFEESLTQTFTTDKPFSHLQLYVNFDNGTENKARYQLTLSDENGTIYYKNVLEKLDKGMEAYVEIPFGEIVPEKETVYTISIVPLYTDSENNYTFVTCDTRFYDVYPHGSLSVDGKTVERDLTFRLVHETISTYTGTTKYLCFGALLLILELLLILLLLKAFGFVNQKRRSVPGGI